MTSKSDRLIDILATAHGDADAKLKELYTDYSKHTHYTPETFTGITGADGNPRGPRTEVIGSAAGRRHGKHQALRAELWAKIQRADEVVTLMTPQGALILSEQDQWNIHYLYRALEMKSPVTDPMAWAELLTFAMLPALEGPALDALLAQWGERNSRLKGEHDNHLKVRIQQLMAGPIPLRGQTAEVIRQISDCFTPVTASVVDLSPSEHGPHRVALHIFLDADAGERNRLQAHAQDSLHRITGGMTLFAILPCVPALNRIREEAADDFAAVVRAKVKQLYPGEQR